MTPKVYKLQKFEIFGRQRPLGGFRMVQKCFPDSASSYFPLQLLKNSKVITVKYSQKYFESTFGWTNVLPKNSKLKLVFKEAEKEPRKAIFPWDLGFTLGQPMWCALISRFVFYNRKQKSNSCKLQILFYIDLSALNLTN